MNEVTALPHCPQHEGNTNDDKTTRKPTVEEAEAILTLVRGGWLRLELTP